MGILLSLLLAATTATNPKPVLTVNPCLGAGLPRFGYANVGLVASDLKVGFEASLAEQYGFGWGVQGGTTPFQVRFDTRYDGDSSKTVGASRLGALVSTPFGLNATAFGGSRKIGSEKTYFAQGAVSFDGKYFQVPGKAGIIVKHDKDTTRLNGFLGGKLGDIAGYAALNNGRPYVLIAKEARDGNPWATRVVGSLDPQSTKWRTEFALAFGDPSTSKMAGFDFYMLNRLGQADGDNLFLQPWDHSLPTRPDQRLAQRGVDLELIANGSPGNTTFDLKAAGVIGTEDWRAYLGTVLPRIIKETAPEFQFGGSLKGWNLDTRLLTETQERFRITGGDIYFSTSVPCFAN